MSLPQHPPESPDLNGTPASEAHRLEIEQLKANDDIPGLGHKVQQLFKLPQSLCKTRGNCCRVATFKGTLSYQEVRRIARSEEPDAPNARDFLTLFIPYETQEEVRELAPEFVDMVRGHSSQDNPDEIGFFRCRFLGGDGRCMVHEDRPTGCRVFPFPHENTIYHPGCGFKQQGEANWKLIQDISQFLEQKFAALNAEIEALEQQRTESLND